MDHSRITQPDPADMAALFERTFTASEGADEGQLIGDLARNLVNTTPGAELWVYGAQEAGTLCGAIVFTTLHFARDPRRVVLLSPVAVAPEYQGQGVGQALLRFGLDDLRISGVDFALSYGDPAFYRRVGFRQITQDEAAPPQPLSFPEGWIGQGLSDRAAFPIIGPSRCAAALDDPAFW